MSNDRVRQSVIAALREMGVEECDVHLERPKDPSHGDLATNVALTLASTLRRSPREIAEELASRVETADTGISSIEIAGPGFLNFHLTSGQLASMLPRILDRDGTFGRSDVGSGEPFMVEFVSANPTGPLHPGHGRQAALGDAIAELLSWTGWAAHREYYYNDAGRQMELLAESVFARYQEALGRDAEIPEGGYPGTYVADVAELLKEKVGDRYLDDRSDESLESMRVFASDELRKGQDRDLTDFRVAFDHYLLESSLYTDGKVESTIGDLKATGLVYDRDGAVWLRTSEFGDQKDRVMVKSDGSPTYFLPDVAYHMNKWERDFHHVINVQGADHHSTVSRVHAGLQALGLPEGYPEYVLHQMVTVLRDGQEVKLSKRAGSSITLRDLFEEVGVDVARYFFLMRKPEAHLVFDLDMALDQSDKNPVYKIQYAHARMCSIFRKAGVQEEEISTEKVDLDCLAHPSERELIQRLAEFPSMVKRAARDRAPHVICEYLEQVAGAVNSWYHAGNPSRNPELAVLVEDGTLRRARLVLARAVQIVLRNGLELLHISAPTRMERAEEGSE
jgi:arginyl-tRNA synthetase